MSLVKFCKRFLVLLVGWGQVLVLQEDRSAFKWKNLEKLLQIEEEQQGFRKNKSYLRSEKLPEKQLRSIKYRICILEASEKAFDCERFLDVVRLLNKKKVL